MEQEMPRRRRRLSAEDKWQIFTEASAKDARVADVLRRWHIGSSSRRASALRSRRARSPS